MLCKEGLKFSAQNIDLHALTEWIPERVAIRPGSSEFDAGKEFERLLDRFHKGHCLVTVATGELNEGDADRAGLVPTHAYAMLDVREIKVRSSLVVYALLQSLIIILWGKKWGRGGGGVGGEVSLATISL